MMCLPISISTVMIHPAQIIERWFRGRLSAQGLFLFATLVVGSYFANQSVKSGSYSGKYGLEWQCICVSDHYILLKILNT